MSRYFDKIEASTFASGISQSSYASRRTWQPTSFRSRVSTLNFYILVTLLNKSFRLTIIVWIARGARKKIQRFPYQVNDFLYFLTETFRFVCTCAVPRVVADALSVRRSSSVGNKEDRKISSVVVASARFGHATAHRV